ncbi:MULTISPECIES: DUF3267 domain-containing protein [unclassified Clostridioides]|nr:DUF3267 domain-containing protein [Clostridioides sp. ES-S-0145-01]MCC0681925.1 DUF3267 domain-containing protein [Clostridioides sp. ES-S-0005-03]MCC0709325.1 DUF3267 domain-containing protein [Clostridioides sp. ES-S-0190-01]UDN64118.1 DUF3267 domain-containing protein [Clostridioides sp. ES-W-0016-02]
MNKISKISKENIGKLDIFLGIIFNILIVTGYILFNDFEYLINNINSKSLFYFITIVIGTVIIHELIHILFFNFFSNGKAKIKIKYDKHIGSIVIYQSNEVILYNKIQTIIILLAPLVLITIISFFCIFYFKTISEILKINLVLNSMGSTGDFILSSKLFHNYISKNILINYSYSSQEGTIMNIYIKK